MEEQKTVIIDGITKKITINEWLEIVEPIIQTRARKYCKPFMKNHSDDILQELRLKACNIFNDYKLDKGTDIKIFAFITLRHKCLNINKKYINKDRKFVTVPSNIVDEKNEDKSTHLLDFVYSKFESDYEKDLIHLISKEGNIKEYAREQNIDYSKIRRDIEKIKKEIREYVKER